MGIKPEDILPDDVNTTEICGTKVRKGTVAAVLANAKILSAKNTTEAEKSEAITIIKALTPALIALELHNHVTWKNSVIQNIIEEVLASKNEANRPVVPPELNWVTTFITVKDAKKSVNFYINEFGFKIHQTVEDNKGKLVFARITYNNSNLVLMPHKAFTGEDCCAEAPAITKQVSPIRIYIYCDDVDKRYAKAKEYGLTIIQPIGQRFWGDKTFRVVDPDGYIWDFATNTADFYPELLPPELL